MKRQFEFVFAIIRGLFFRVAGALANFAFFVVLGRGLGVAETGTFMLGFGVVVVLSAVGRLGLEQVIVREATPAINENNSKRLSFIYINSLFWVVFISLFLSAILFFLLISYSFVFATENTKYYDCVLWVCLSIPALSVAYIHVPFLQAARKPEASVAILGFWIPFVSLFLISIFDVKNASNAFLIYFVACFFVMLISFFQWVFWKNVPIVFCDFLNKIKSRVLINSGFPLVVGNFFLMSIPWIGVYVAGLLLTPSVVGIISVAQRVSMTIVGFLMPPVEALIGPRLTDLMKQGSSSVELYSRNVSALLTLIVSLIFLVLIFFGEKILNIFGNGFEDGYALLMVLCFGQLVFVACGPTRLVLVYSGAERFIRNSMAVSAIACALLCFVLIPVFGGIGAAIATSISISAQKIGEMYFALKQLGIKTYPSFSNLIGR